MKKAAAYTSPVIRGSISSEEMGPLCDSNYYGEDINWEEDEPASSDPSYEGEGITWY